MQRFRLLFQIFSTIIFLLTVCLPVQAQTNSIANPGFETDLSGWAKAFGRPGVWSPVDAGGSGVSGSALLGNEGTGDGVVPFVLVQCFECEGPGLVEWGGDLFIPGGQPSGTQAFIFLEPFDNSTCFGNPIDGLMSTASSQVGDWNSVSKTITTPSETLSVRVSLGVLKPFGEMADAEAYFDNIFLVLPDSPPVIPPPDPPPTEGFEVNPSMSASWFNPAESGHGIMIHLFDENTAWMCWFTFELTGEPTWICAVGTIIGDTIVFEDAFTVEGGAFPPNFDQDMIVEIPWGTIVIVFTGCNEGSMTWTTSAPGFTSGSMPLVRLGTAWGLSCP